MEKQIIQIEQFFQFLEDEYSYELYYKSPPSTKICKSINYYKDYRTIEIQLHKNLTYFYLNVITEKDESFTITSFNNKMIFCDELTNENLQKSKLKLLDFLTSK